MPPRGLLHGLGNVARHIPGPFVRRCSTIRKEWWFSSRMVHSSDGGEGPSHIDLHGAAIQPAEDICRSIAFILHDNKWNIGKKDGQNLRS